MQNYLFEMNWQIQIGLKLGMINQRRVIWIKSLRHIHHKNR